MENKKISSVKYYKHSKSANNSPKHIHKKKKFLDKTLSRRDISKKIIEIKNNKQSLNDEYLEYIINEKMKYADIDKIFEYYNERLNSRVKIFNDNLCLIQQKKEYLKKLNLALYGEIVKSIDFVENDQKYEDYHKEIEKIKKEIKFKNHQIDVFQDIYYQSYKLNFKLMTKLRKESKYFKIYDEQYQKYNDIYINSKNKMQIQEGRLDALKIIHTKSQVINKSLISKRVEKLKKLEYKIELIKNNVVNYEKNLGEMKTKYKEYHNIANFCKKDYFNKKKEFINYTKNYLREYYLILKIYHIFEVDDLGKILSDFNIIKQKNNELSLRFNELSKQNILLSMELKDYNNKLEQVKKKN